MFLRVRIKGVYDTKSTLYPLHELVTTIQDGNVITLYYCKCP
jgi:hypothetical protein